jgi:hypothetical protein
MGTAVGRLLAEAKAMRLARHQRRLWKSWGLDAPTRAFIDRYGLTVRHGPFAGMRYPTAAVGRTDMLVAKLLGAYEQELHAVLEAESHGRLFIDVGCAEGYYAVGLARARPDLEVRAFDIDPFARKWCRELARLNGVHDRVSVQRAFSVDSLDVLPSEDVLVLSDCEGAEIEIFQPELVRRLGRATVVIELHPVSGVDVTSTLRARFAATHRAELITSAQRASESYPELQDLDEAQRHNLLSEHRSWAASWLVLRPGAPPNSA